MGNEEGREVGGSQVGYKPVGVETSPGDVGNDCVLDNNYESSISSRKTKRSPCRISKGCQSDKRICFNELRGLLIETTCTTKQRVLYQLWATAVFVKIWV